MSGNTRLVPVSYRLPAAKIVDDCLVGHEMVTLLVHDVKHPSQKYLAFRYRHGIEISALETFILLPTTWLYKGLFYINKGF
jgi:hypothetical protein